MESAVHPHACGEYGVKYGIWSSFFGSPPRVWGILHRLPNFFAPMRFTPTRVGNTDGERIFFQRGCGSPPRVWGILVLCALHRRVDRFTPTRVGNTSDSFLAAVAATVHPHACGEYSPNFLKWCKRCGSPPRVWGIRYEIVQSYAGSRFTPTRVGNTCSPRRIFRPPAVHPHACGEYAVSDSAAEIPPGSPPRVWGIHVEIFQRARRIRFTPTRVGNTKNWIGRPSVRSVHPHACGEYSNRAASPR